MNWLALALIGGLVGLDGTSFPQIMISRPLVAGTLTGLIFGRPMEGALIGAVLEIFALIILPIGAARYPEAGVGAVAAAGAYLSIAGPVLAPGYLILAVAFGLLWEWVGGASVIAMRRINEILIAGANVEWSDRKITRRHLSAMAIDFVRGAIVSLAGAIGGWGLLRAVGGYWGIELTWTLGVLGIASSCVLGALLPLFGGWDQKKFAFILGLVCGSLLVLVR